MTGKLISENVPFVTDKFVMDTLFNDKSPPIESADKVPLIFTLPLMVMDDELIVEAFIKGLTISVLLIKSSAII